MSCLGLGNRGIIGSKKVEVIMVFGWDQLCSIKVGVTSGDSLILPWPMVDDEWVNILLAFGEEDIYFLIIYKC